VLASCCDANKHLDVAVAPVADVGGGNWLLRQKKINGPTQYANAVVDFLLAYEAETERAEFYADELGLGLKCQAFNFAGQNS